ncbi:DUF4138 domain-containing protein [Formosa sp. A9]|uniref:DUF4138 domain-containing protein n=1 Tax=Formosa sp. A9 TaxID=3442641 RepID=UPI003EBBB104
MKRSYILILALSFYSMLQAQHPKPLDTIFANDYQTVGLFFQHPIKQGITGSKHFVFSYNREQSEYFGLLQASPGKDSNLLLISQSGEVYAYYLKYCKELKVYNYFISGTSAIGYAYPKTDPIPKDSLRPLSVPIYDVICQELINTLSQAPIKTRKKYDVSMSLQNIVYRQGVLYFVLDLHNASTLDYTINYLEVAITIKKRGQHSSMQKSILKPVYTYQLPKMLKQHKKARVVYAVPKFSISKAREILITLNEAHGERHLTLALNHKIINQPH